MLFASIAAWWAASAIIAGAAGAVVGVVVPALCYTGRLSRPDITTPDAVADGRVLQTSHGAHSRFGWDRAWPLYLPHQGLRDAAAVRSGAQDLGTRTIAFARSLWWRPGEGAVRTAVSVVTAVLWVIVVLPALVGALVGLVVSVGAWHLVIAVAGGALAVAQAATIGARRTIEATLRTQRRTTSRCPRCYAVDHTPSYLCTNTGCLVIHRDLSPGPLGVFHRRCSCQAIIPATVRAGGQHLVAVCPTCRRELPRGSGTRQVMFLPVIGAVASGKTQFLSAAVISIADRVKAHHGEFTAISPTSRAFLKAAEAAVTTGRRVAKTPWDDRPEGLPFRLTQGTVDKEVQLMDAAGEAFADEDRSRALVYFDTSDVILLMLDPLALPKVMPLYDASDLAGSVSVADGDPTRAYRSVVQRLKAEQVDLTGKHLGVVVSKADIVHELMGEDVLDAADGGAVRRWLSNRGLDDFVATIESDFGTVGYFAVDSYSQRDQDDPLHPFNVLDWAFHEAGFWVEAMARPDADNELEGALK
ncbi:TRAFAC clade GTPase domain-containing protein [Nocardioides bizhenqiangii]|uniref:Double-GTPase 2 domain-containing protein n=1 Tax=Nocardioides bizhenqiangii TaxID=3095076 RepID=A0ABZ0ZJM2_9ACTN|nr:hypothetical protein [Nocardioides sp. HM61]WQQ24686.1 hypothetical protein SHK19_11970 [Nocardioides sp. HM61]